MRRPVILIALAVILPLLLGASEKGCSATPPPPAGGGVQQAPAEAPGKCVASAALTHILGRIVGTLKFRCTGAAVLTVTMFLRYDDSSGDVTTQNRKTVNSAADTSPAMVSAPCRTGKWWLRVVGEEMGVGATLPVGPFSSQVIDVVC